MESLFENVVGNVLHIQDFYSSIPFTTPSDALFSSLFVKFKGTVPMEVFDAMLALFRHADFHSDQVTMQNSEDIFERISAQRQQIAKDRNSRRVPDQIAARSSIACHPEMTNLIPALLAEYIDSQRLPFLRVVDHDFHRYNRKVIDRELETMSLVHRSWTDAAQRYLRRYAFLWSPTCLRSVMQSTIIGPWVRELSISCALVHSDTDITINETPRLQAGVLHRCPNITCLDLREYETVEASQAFVAQLAGLKHLEHLLLRSISGIDCLEFWKLAAIPKNLLSLKSLSFRDCRIDAVMSPKGQDAISPDAPILPLSLEALSLVDVQLVNSGLFSRLLSPRSGITKLEFCPDVVARYEHSPDLGTRTSLMNATTTRITKLRLVSCWSTDMVNFILGCFPSLQLLSVYPNYYADVPLGSLVLPYSTTRSFHYHYLRAQDNDQDPLALALLEAYPNLRHFLITYAASCKDVDCVDQHPISLSFANSIEYAERNGVNFQVTQAELEDMPHNVLLRIRMIETRKIYASYHSDRVIRLRKSNFCTSKQPLQLRLRRNYYYYVVGSRTALNMQQGMM